MTGRRRAGSAIEEQERLALRAISVTTIASGATQALAPGVLLGALGVEESPATRQLFATIGMFMVIVGGILLGASGRRAQTPAIGWCATQKLGAAGAVAVGVRRGVFSPLALGVAAFDFASGLLALDYRRRLSCR
jgi:hypothetical protein